MKICLKITFRSFMAQILITYSLLKTCLVIEARLLATKDTCIISREGGEILLQIHSISNSKIESSPFVNE